MLPAVYSRDIYYKKLIIYTEKDLMTPRIACLLHSAKMKYS